jgi:hypothetical protein
MVAWKSKLAAVIACAAIVSIADVIVLSEMDGRSFRSPIERRFSVRNSTWHSVCSDPLLNLGWFKRELRCSRSTFDAIVDRIRQRWTMANPLPDPSRTVFGIDQRVAVTMYYLMHPGSFHSAGAVFGMSKTRTMTYVNEVMKVLIECYGKETIKIPTALQDWLEIEQGFEHIAGMSGVIAAVDGSLFEVHRMEDFEGWYCRKGFPAFNVQVVVDHKLRFMSYSIRSGSQNDKSLWNKLHFGRNLQQIIPRGKYVIADAGYKLTNLCITPYKIELGMSTPNSHFNWIHSRTRMTVERSLGLLKGKFRIFETALHGNSPQAMVKVIQSSMILHNWLVDAGDNIESFQLEPWMHIDPVPTDEIDLVDGEAASKTRDLIREFLYQYVDP